MNISIKILLKGLSDRLAILLPPQVATRYANIPMVCRLIKVMEEIGSYRYFLIDHFKGYRSSRLVSTCLTVKKVGECGF